MIRLEFVVSNMDCKFKTKHITESFGRFFFVTSYSPSIFSFGVLELKKIKAIFLKGNRKRVIILVLLFSMEPNYFQLKFQYAKPLPHSEPSSCPLFFSHSALPKLQWSVAWDSIRSEWVDQFACEKIRVPGLADLAGAMWQDKPQAGSARLISERQGRQTVTK